MDFVCLKFASSSSSHRTDSFCSFEVFTKTNWRSEKERKKTMKRTQNNRKFTEVSFDSISHLFGFVLFYADLMQSLWTIWKCLSLHGMKWLSVCICAGVCLQSSFSLCCYLLRFFGKSVMTNFYFNVPCCIYSILSMQKGTPAFTYVE